MCDFKHTLYTCYKLNWKIKHKMGTFGLTIYGAQVLFFVSIGLFRHVDVREHSLFFTSSVIVVITVLLLVYI